MEKEKPIMVVWFSCGAASAVAAKKTVEVFGKTHQIMIVNTYIKEEDEDNQRFLLDVSKWVGLPIIHARNVNINTNSAVEIWEQRKYISGVEGAPCTKILKKEARYQFEKQHKIAWHVLGYTFDEIHRHHRFATQERFNIMPVLICQGITKKDCFKIITDAGIKLPRIYEHFENANCVGCGKASGVEYWQKVRTVFPEIFKARAEQSRRIGARLVRYKGKRIYLDELPLDAKGRKIKTPECGIFCDTK